MLNHTT